MNITEDPSILVETLQNGGICIFPTDTAFGIGCRIDDETSVKKLFEIRKRPENKPLLALVDSIEMAEKYVEAIDPEVRSMLMENYWPGGLTIVLPSKTGRVPEIVRGGGRTLGIRLPNHEVIRSVVKQLGVSLLAPSANFAGEPTPFTLDEIDTKLLEKVDCVLKGTCTLKEQSTVIDCSQKTWGIVREGAVKIES